MSKKNRNDNSRGAVKSKPQTGWGYWPLLLLAVLTLIAYLPGFNSAFQFDDWSTMLENPDITGFNLKAILCTIHRPLLRLTFALNCLLSPKDLAGNPLPFGFHLINFLLHLANCWLLFLLGKKLLGRFKYGEAAAFLASLCFALHPVNTETVTYITSRSSLLCAFFLLLGLYLYRLYRERGGSGYLIGALAAYPLSFLAKPIGIVLPFLIVLLEWCGQDTLPEEREGSFSWRPSLPFWIILLLGALAIGVSQKSFSGLLTDYTPRSLGVHICSELAVLAVYFRLMVLPVKLNLDYDLPMQSSLFAPLPLIGLLLLAGLIFGVSYFYRRQKVVCFALGFMLVNLLTVTVPILADLIFEHHLYLPLMGFSLLVFTVLGLGWEKYRWNTETVLALLAVLVVLLGAGTFRRNLVWVTEDSLWKDVLAKSPNKSRPHYNYGLPLAKRLHNYRVAIEEFQQAIRLYNPQGSKPGQSDRLLSEYNYNLAAAYYYLAEEAKAPAESAEDLRQSEIYTRESLRLFPDNAKAAANLGNLYMKQNNWREAIPLYLQALELSQQNNYNVWGNLGAAYYLAGDPDKSLDALQRSLEQNPDQPGVYSNLLSMCRAFGRLDKAQAVISASLPRVRNPQLRLQLQQQLQGL